MGGETFLARRHAGAPLPAAALYAIFRQGRALDIAGMRDRDGYVLALDQVLVFDFDLGFDDLGLARRGELLAHHRELFLDDGEHARTRAQDVEIIRNRDAELLDLLGDLRDAERRQTLQADFEYRLGLFLGQPDRVVGHDKMARVGDQRHQRTHILRGPGTLHQLRLRGRGAGRRAD